MILAAGAAYVTGRLQTSALIDTAEKQAQVAEQKVETQRGEAAQLNQLLLRYEARRRLHLVLIALEERNFGIAKEHLQAAADFLQKSAPVPASEVAKLQDVMAKYQLVAREDLSTERGVVQGWSKRLDQELALPAGLQKR